MTVVSWRSNMNSSPDSPRGMSPTVEALKTASAAVGALATSKNPRRDNKAYCGLVNASEPPRAADDAADEEAEAKGMATVPLAWQRHPVVGGQGFLSPCASKLF